MTKTNIISVWKALLSEGDESARITASNYINENAASILKSLMEEDNENIPSSLSSSSTGDNIITVVYSDPDADCDFDDDIINASGKDDYDSAGWSKGKRIISFLFDDAEAASQAAAQIGDLSDSIDGLTVQTPDSEVSDETVEVSPETVSDEDETVVTEDESNTITVSFPSDGDSTVVDEFASLGLDIASTDITPDGKRVIVVNCGDLDSQDVIPVVQDAFRGLGISDYEINADEVESEPVSIDYDTDGVVGEDSAPTDTDDSVNSDSTEEQSDDSIGDTLDSLSADIEALKAELAAAGISLSSDAEINGSGDEESPDVTGLEEAFLGYEDVKIPVNKDLNDGKSPLVSTSTKDRLKPASPIKSPAGKLTGDGTKQETSPTVKSLPSTKNTVKGNVEKTYTKVSKEGDKSAKINSKEGFGEEGKDSIID